MKKTNVQVIKELRQDIDRLRHELGRYRKKVSDQQREIAELERCAAAMEAYGQDRYAFVCATAKAYGQYQTLTDGKESWSLALPMYSFLEMYQDYDLQYCRNEETRTYEFQVTKKEDGHGEL